MSRRRARASTAVTPPQEPSRGTWQQWLSSPALLSLLLVLITGAVYARVTHCDFVNYDDPDYITSNAHVQSGITWPNVVWAFTSSYASNWHPLTWLSHMLDHTLFGNAPGPQHLVNLGFHLANSVLVFLLLRRATGRHWRSATVAALFALHPLHVESVAWMSERKDVLSTLFFLLTLWAYVRAVSKRKLREALGDYILALVLFAFGLMSKPMLVTLPFVLLLLDYWPLGRLALGQERTGGQVEPESIGRLLVEKIPFFALAIGSCVITYIAQEKGGAVSTSISLGGRLANALVSYARYLGKTFWPPELSVLYPHPGYWAAAAVIASALLLAVISGVVIWQWRARPYLLVGWAWFVGTLVPAIGLIQVGIQALADRYTYIPLIGLFISLVWGLCDLVPVGPRRQNTLVACAAFSLLACSFLTIHQVGFWQNSATLFQRAVQVTPNNYLAYNNLGFYYSGNGDVAAAVTNYVKALEIKPDYEDALNNMGYALAGMRRFPEAISYYERALRVRTNQVEVLNNLGNALSELGKLDQAIAEYEYVLKLAPEHADAHNNLGIALAMKGRLEEAVPHFEAAIRSKPSYASAHSNLGNAYAAEHKLDLAIREYEICLDLNPKDPQAHNNLGNALSEQGRLEEAIAQYSEALRLNANNPEAHFNLGLAFARQGKIADAKAECQEALRLRPDYPEAQRQLQLLNQK